ncbi:hypothetical protein N0V82_003369 [Gnomoniopsis sp. IMI 355080]|nr:hypothetical protein N0V82_003369 [Gnomoniopsis sp. IMI 355080]
MCRIHGTECRFPAEIPEPGPSADTTSWTGRANEVEVDDYQPTPLATDDSEQQNTHIVGPANTADSQVLADYLSTITTDNGGIRMVRPLPGSRSKPVLFSTVQKRPIGVEITACTNQAREKLNIIEQYLAPWAEQFIELYFRKINICLPLLDHGSFKSQYKNEKDKISPALLASLYAHSTMYWRLSSNVAGHRALNDRFIWNLANEVLYSELHLSPGISTITAILLNVGGRPTTSLIGNGVQLGAAVSLAHSLGLNRDPSSWDIPDSEKLLRMKIWWSLLIHDKWSSLAHGTPPRIQRAQHDVPSPELSHFCLQDEGQAAPVFIALSGLTEVLDHYLQVLYCVDPNKSVHTADLEFRLNQWVQKLDAEVRRIITRGTQLHLPGGANLRLAYLSTQLLLRRIELENDTDKEDIGSQMLANRYMQVQRTAEEIVVLVQELHEDQLRDFWLPMSAFVFSSTTTFLLRCALETEDSQAAVAQSSSLRLAWDLLTALRGHRDKMGWELGDICLAQHEGIVQRLMATLKPGGPQLSTPGLQEIALQDPEFIEELFPNLWDIFQVNT